MHSDTRYVVAYIVGRHYSGTNATNIYAVEEGSYHALTGTVSAEQVNIYDFDRACHISGTRSLGRLTLFDFGRSAHLNLNTKNDGSFDGFDYGTSSFFKGKVTGRNVSLYDFEAGNYFNFRT